MKTIEVSEEVYAALQRLAAASGHPHPSAALAALLQSSSRAPAAVEPLAAFVLSSAFRSLPDESERYLAVLSWVARHHPAEFSEFIRSQSTSRRFLSLSREEVVATCRRNLARQIDGTQYWAVMNLDSSTKRRFVARLLEFAGYPDFLTRFVCEALFAAGDTTRAAA
jgi:negative regulator of replication initiation